LVVLFFVLFHAGKRTKNGSTILTRSACRLRLDGKSSIWSLRRLFGWQSNEAHCQLSFRTGAGGSPFYQVNGEALTTGGSNRVFSVKPFLILFPA
jgi:hypothetical protein